MKTVFGAVILTLGVAAGVPPALAQVQAPQARINVALARARQVGVPVTLLENKMAEGKAKGVPMERIAAAIERREAALERASQAMKGQEGVGDADLSVGADAVEAGVSEAVLKAVTESAPRERRAVAVAALTQLVQQGIAPETALDRVKNALKRGPDALGGLAAEGRGRGTPNGQGNAYGRDGAPGPPANVPAPGGTTQPRKPAPNPQGPSTHDTPTPSTPGGQRGGSGGGA